MKKLLMVLGFAIGVNGIGFAQVLTPTIDVQIGSDSNSVANIISDGNGTYGLSHNWAWTDPNMNASVSLFTQTASGSTQFSSDPAISYAMSATNSTSSTQTYTMTFSLPLSPALSSGQLVDVASTISGSVSAPNTTPVQIGLGLYPYIQQNYIGAVASGNDAGVDLLGASSTPLSITPADPVFGIYSAPFGPYNSGTTYSTYTLSSSASQINVVTSFSLSPGDSASFDGAFIVSTGTSAVPEPSEELLRLAGLGALIVAVLRRRRSA